MPNQTRKIGTIMAIVGTLGAGAMLLNAAPPKDSFQKPQDRLLIGEDEVKRLLVIMGPDRTGKVSKAEYMKFMEAEFERLDKTKSGALDVSDLAQPTISASRFVGK